MNAKSGKHLIGVFSEHEGRLPDLSRCFGELGRRSCLPEQSNNQVQGYHDNAVCVHLRVYRYLWRGKRVHSGCFKRSSARSIQQGQNLYQPPRLPNGAPLSVLHYGDTDKAVFDLIDQADIRLYLFALHFITHKSVAVHVRAQKKAMITSNIENWMC
jgi:hypothetical protein